jgi:hypothetical protein
LKSPSGHEDVLQIVADSFPTAGPFYVGWREFCFLHHWAGTHGSFIGSYLLHRITWRNRAFPV